MFDELPRLNQGDDDDDYFDDSDDPYYDDIYFDDEETLDIDEPDDYDEECQ